MAVAKADKALVERVLAQERAAFDEFFAAYFGRLCRFCRARIGPNDAIEDIVQETLVKALRNLHTYRGEALLFSWLCQICRNEISTWYKRHGQKLAVTASIDDDPGVMAALESFGIELQGAADERIALADMIQITLDYLPNNYGRALEMKYLEGLSVKEIARALDISRLATQSLLARARTAFREGFLDLQRELQTPLEGKP